ncbi:protocadherin beta-16-like [Polymixia lowei]
MILQKPLDREEYPRLSLKLIAVDGGTPQRSVVKAQDGGSPPLSSNVTVTILIQDQNDNAPQVLYPVQTGGSLVAEMVPRSADVGYLVTKVVAVDVDSGQNAWLSYKIQKATDRALFEVGLQNGEIRTIRQVTDKDVVKQRLTVVVEDNGQPSRSATVNVNVAVADSFPEVLSETTDSRKSDCKFGQNILIMDPSYTGTMQRIQSEKNILDEPDSPLEFALLTVFFGMAFRKPPLHNCAAWGLFCRLQRLVYLLIFLLLCVYTSDGQIRYSIPEEMKKGSLIGNVAQDLGLDLKRLRSGRARIVTEESIQYTELKTDKGILVVNERIDREQLCGDVTPCSFTFEILLENPMELHYITIEILDVNDNVPTFQNSHLQFDISESVALGSRFGLESADDTDVGQNGLQNYILTPNDNFVLKQHANPDGSKYAEMVLQKPLDREKQPRLSLKLLAVDGGTPQRSGTVNIDITVLDANDNAPVFNQSVYKATVIENTAKGTNIITVNATDADSGSNGQISYSFSKMKGGITDIFTINESNGTISVSDQHFDREITQEYNITITATDSGSPPLSSSITLQIKISDVNDNAPLFDKITYSAYVTENNSPGISIFTVNARDSDWNQNARISYLLEETQISDINGVAVSSFVSVNSENGVIHAVRSFDYEQIKGFEFNVTARDGGSPPLSSVATIKILIQDQNDNAPQVLYPVQTGGSLVAEMVPRSADVGYLVTKVVAVDVDSGQNAWLSYKLQKATDRALFEVGLQNGEIRTIRQVTDKDVVKQRLTVVVEDNGQPSRSATVNVNVAVADSFPEVLSEFTDFTHDKEYNDNLTFYLVLALAVVSFLFITCLVVIISVKIYRWRQSRVLYHSSLPVIPYYPPRYSDTLGTGTLQHVYNYEVCRTTDSRKSDCKFGGAGSQNILIMDPSYTGTMQRIQSEKNILDEPDSPLEGIFSTTAAGQFF